MIDQIKMIVTDLDGSLLCDDKTVSEFSIKTLWRCKDKGIKIVYATGRGDNLKQVVPFELFDGYVINNGAVAYAGNEIIYSKLMHLLSYAGIGIAMGNALEEVKNTANQVCLSNEEDGIATWIIENILTE